MKKISLLGILFLGIVFSCQKEDNQSSQDKNAVGLTEVTTAASNIGASDVVKSIAAKKGTQASRSDSKIINEIVAVPNQNNPSYYIINYVGGGWAIISGDKRINPVLAYSDNSKFQTSGAIHYGLLKWLTGLHQTVQNLKSNVKTSSLSAGCPPVAAMWNQLGLPINCGGGSGGSGGGDSGGSGCTQTSSSAIAGPLLTVAWSQDCGYNGFCPVNTAGYCGHDLTGCVATAMAQVMDHWQKPTFYNWPAMQPYSADLYTLMNDAGV